MAKTKEEKNKYDREYRMANKEKRAKNSRKYYLKNRHNKLKIKDTVLKRKFGITLEDYNKMLIEQNQVCAICKQPENSFNKIYNKRKDLCVDHCHDTGKIRSLLCMKCNSVLGFVNEDKEILKSMIDYIEKFNNK